jgi:predicted RNA binding protein with dsRBD fold (UPF0201 family)
MLRVKRIDDDSLPFGKEYVMGKAATVALIAALLLALSAGAHAGDLDKLKKKLADEIGRQDYTSAASTMSELGEEDSIDAVKIIVSLALNNNIESQEIFDAAKSALAKTTNKEAISFLCDLAKKKSSDWRLKALLAEVFGELQGKEVVDTLRTLLKEKQPEVLREVIISLSKLGDTDAVDDLIEALEKLEKEKGLVWVEARKALTALTSHDELTAEKWRDYWQARKEELKANPGSPETAKPTTKGDMSTSLEEEIRKAPKFFGKEIMSKRIVFVIDVSGSMIMKDRDTAGGEAGPGGQQGGSEYSQMAEDRMRINRAKNELKKAVAGLPATAKFNIIAFANYVSPWQKQKLVPANTQNKNAAIAFVDKFHANGGTFTDDVLKEAFANKEADTIFFLSDGAPERYGSVAGQENPQNEPLIGQCLDFVRSENKFRKVKIFAFGFDGEGVWDPNLGPKPPYHQKAQRFIDFMRKLAEENGGEYKSIK